MTPTAAARCVGGLGAAGALGVLCGSLIASSTGSGPFTLGQDRADATATGTPAPLVVRGSITGLAPGTPSAVEVQVSNPNPSALVVQRVVVVAGDASPECRAGQLEVAAYDGELPGALRYPLPGGGSAVVPLAIQLVDLPRDQDACKDVVFPLTYRVTATGGPR
jgi:hypothetical protein